MKARASVSVIVVALVAVGACSEFKPGSYEGGGRSGGPIIIGGAGSGCTPVGNDCQSSDECCSHLCAFTGQVLACAPPPSDSGPACVVNNGACNLDTDCCSAYCAPSKLCANPVVDSGGGGG